MAIEYQPLYILSSGMLLQQRKLETIPTLKRKFEELEMKSLIKELENLSQRVAQKSLF